MRMRLLLASGLVVLASVVCRPVVAQQDSTAQDTTVVSTTISIAELPTRATAFGDTLQVRYSALREDAQLDEFQAEVSQSLDSIQAERAALDVTNLEAFGFRRLDDLRLRWQGVQSLFEGWQSELADRSRALDSTEAALDTAANLWGEARDSAVALAVPENVLDRVGDLLALIDSANVEVEARRQQVLRIQGDAADGFELAGAAVLRIDAARTSARRRILVRTDPFVWQLWTRPSGETLQKAPFGIADVREFAADREGTLWGQSVLFFVLLMLTVALKQRMDLRVAEDVPAGVRRALKRPGAAAVLLTLVITPVLHEPLPAAVAEFAILVVALAVFRLAPLYVRPPRHRALMVLLALGATHQLFELFAANPIVIRLELLAVSVAMAWALERLRAQVSERQYLIDKLLHAMMRAGAVLLGVAFLANVLGFLNLVVVVIDGAIGTIIITVALVMAVDAVEGIVAAISHQRFFGTIPGFRLHQAMVTSRALQVVRFGAVLLWLSLVATAFGVGDLLGFGILALWRAELPVGAWTLSVGSILTFVFSVWLAFAIGRTVRAILRDDVLRRMRLARGMPNTIATLTFYAIVMLGFVFGVGAAGVDLSAFALIFGALGVGIGFGLQNIVNDFISGLVLMFERPIQVGDIVQLDDLIGNVSDIGIRASTVKTFEGAEVIVPNGQLISSRVVNWTLSDRTRRIDVSVGVAYGTSPSVVIDLLREIATNHPDVRSNPEPLVFFNGFGESSLDFELRIWTNEFLNWRQVASDVTVAVNDALVGAGIEIPFPQRDLHVRSVAEDVAAKMLKRGSSASTKGRKR
jgi:small-conductance mechanosensitive channel